MTMWGDKVTGEVRTLRLTVSAYKRVGGGASGPWDFDNPTRELTCEGEELAILRSLLNEEFRKTGSYRAIESDVDLARLLSDVQSGQLRPDQLHSLVAAISKSDSFVDALIDLDSGPLVAAAVELHHQRRALEDLRKAVEDPTSTERAIHAKIKGNWWLFGGRYIEEADRARFTSLDELDVPLIRADHVLHIVELKKANVPDLVIPHRSHSIVGPSVNEAAGQAMNYLREFDQQAANIKLNHGIECQRAFATVVIGHPAFSSKVRDEYEISKAVRTYNSHLSRVEVITYKDLIEWAEQAVSIKQEANAVVAPILDEADPFAGVDWSSASYDEPPF